MVLHYGIGLIFATHSHEYSGTLGIFLVEFVAN